MMQYRDFVKVAHHAMTEKTATGSEFLGWLEWPKYIKDEEIQEIEDFAKTIQESANILVVIGIGGSYLGAKAIQEMLCSHFTAPHEVEVIYAGHHLSGRYLTQLMNYLDEKDVFVNVISKSGTTTEPAVAFRLIRQYMEKRYGSDSAKRIVATTDAENGALRTLSEEAGYKTFSIPDDIGGRYSVFTAVGLLPLAAAGISIREFLNGAKKAMEDLSSSELEENTAYQYAAARQQLMAKGFSTEILASFEANMVYVHEWWKQLFGESEGKTGKGIFPASVIYPTDLHSMGQYIQDGRRLLFETILQFEENGDDLMLDMEEDNRDGLNYLADKTFSTINRQSFDGVAFAHSDGGVPVLALRVGAYDAYHAGYLLYFFMKACAMSAYLSGVNPFDQPGVEAYKQNLYALLGKPGFEARRKELEERLYSNE